MILVLVEEIVDRADAFTASLSRSGRAHFSFFFLLFFLVLFFFFNFFFSNVLFGGFSSFSFSFPPLIHFRVVEKPHDFMRNTWFEICIPIPDFHTHTGMPLIQEKRKGNKTERQLAHLSYSRPPTVSKQQSISPACSGHSLFGHSRTIESHVAFIIHSDHIHCLLHRAVDELGAVGVGMGAVPACEIVQRSATGADEAISKEYLADLKVEWSAVRIRDHKMVCLMSDQPL